MPAVFTYDFPRPVKLEKGNQMGLAIITGSVAMDSSYPTGGEDISTTLKAKFGTLLQLMIEPSVGYNFVFDKTNSKIMAYYADYDAVADGAFIQVANAADLSGVTAAKFIAIGFA
jgi:hypothetical protein